MSDFKFGQEMKIEINVISMENIHPSSPIPNNVLNYKLSFTDQIQAPAFITLTFFYEAIGNNLTKSEISSQQLKKSLSETLSLYYPLAGRIVDNSYVHNDHGVKYVEAQANCKLSEFIINKPITQELEKLLPVNIYDVAEVCMVIQVTFFNCGGLAIAVSVSHKICDAWSLSLFVNSWAAISRGDVYIQSPILDGATLFTQRELSGYDPRNEMLTIAKDLIMTKRFLFSSSKINELRDIYTNTTRPTRIEALSAFIWTRFMVSIQTNDKLKREFFFTFPVNIRKRAIPPLSDNLFGNFIHPVTPLFDGKNGLVEKMREAICSIDGDYVKKLQEGGKILNILNFDTVKKCLRGEMEPITFTSLCRLPLYEADFGWGKPIWITIGSPQKNRVAFMDSVSGGGIEVWITLMSEDMAKFEADEDFLAYTET